MSRNYATNDMNGFIPSLPDARLHRSSLPLLSGYHRYHYIKRNRGTQHETTARQTFYSSNKLPNLEPGAMPQTARSRETSQLMARPDKFFQRIKMFMHH
jgi:hypothetical protein